MKTKYILCWLVLLLAGCGATKPQQQNLANVKALDQQALADWSALMPRLKLDNATVALYASDHTEHLTKQTLSFSALLKSANTEKLHAATITKLQDQAVASQAVAKHFDALIWNKALLSNDGSDLTAALAQHSSKLHALADAVNTLAVSFNAKGNP